MWTCNDTLDDDTIPRQTNCDDCGVFVCAYAEHVLADFKFEFDQGDMPGYRKKLFASLFNGSIMRPKTKPSIERQESHHTTENRTSTAADEDAPASNCDVTNETSDTETLATKPVKIMLPCNYELKEGDRPRLEPIRSENKATPIDMEKL